MLESSSEQIQLNYQLQGDGELVVLLHGLLGNLRNLNTLAKTLDKNYRVCSVDLPNHGASPSSETMAYSDMADAVLAVIDRLGDDKFRLMGHSMGGKVAMAVALKAPDRVTHLLIEDIAPVAYPPHHREILDAMLAIDFTADNQLSRQIVDNKLASAIPDNLTRQFVMLNLHKRGDCFMWKANIKTIALCYPQIMAAVKVDPASTYHGNTLFVAGAKSRYITNQMVEEITVLFPKAKFRQIAEAGHWIHAEKAQVFNALTQRFFDIKP